MRNAQFHAAQTQAQSGRGTMARAAIRLVLFLALTVAAPFVAAGRLDWWSAWTLVVINLVSVAVSRIIPARRNPDLLVERARASGGTGGESWDRLLMPLVAIVGPLFVWVTAGLDERCGWSPGLVPGLQAAAVLAVAAGSAFATWAMIANRFFSAVVRIQTDRGHAVISSGPYRIVRHPSYAVQGRTGCGIPELGPDSLERPHPPTPSPRAAGKGTPLLGGVGGRQSRPPTPPFTRFPAPTAVGAGLGGYSPNGPRAVGGIAHRGGGNSPERELHRLREQTCPPLKAMPVGCWRR